MLLIVRKAILLVALMLLPITALVIALNLHELGHTIVARLSGDQTAVYFLYHREANGGLCIGCNIYNEQRLTYAGNLAVTVAGVLTTQAIAVCCVLFSRRQTPKSTAKRISLLITAAFLIDAPWQVFAAITANVSTQHHLTRIDLADTIYLVMSRIPLSSVALKAMLIGCLGLYATFLFWLYRFAAKRATATVIPPQIS